MLCSSIEYIKNTSSVSQHVVSCLETSDCLETKREVVVRLKMIEWGLLGLGEATAGLYLAFHYGKLGPYFGNKDTNLWPHNPLSKNATELELALNELFMDITKALS